MLKTKEDFEELLTKCFKNEDIYNRLPKQIIEAYKALAVRLSDVVENFHNSNYPSKSTFGSQATGTCQFYRTDDSAEVTLPSGSLAYNLEIGEEITFDEDLIFLSGSLESNIVNWTSVDKSFSANYYPNTLLYLKNYSTKDIIFGKIITSNEDGADDGLSYLGIRKNIQPYDGETEVHFRKRFRDIENKITITAIEAIVSKYFSDAYVKECFEIPGPAAAYDVTQSDYTGFFFADYADHSFAAIEDLLYLRMPINNIPQAWYVVFVKDINDLSSEQCSLMCEELKDATAAGISWHVEVGP